MSLPIFLSKGLECLKKPLKSLQQRDLTANVRLKLRNSQNRETWRLEQSKTIAIDKINLKLPKVKGDVVQFAVKVTL